MQINIMIGKNQTIAGLLFSACHPRLTFILLFTKPAIKFLYLTCSSMVEHLLNPWRRKRLFHYSEKVLQKVLQKLMNHITLAQSQRSNLNLQQPVQFNFCYGQLHQCGPIKYCK